MHSKHCISTFAEAEGAHHKVAEHELHLLGTKQLQEQHSTDDPVGIGMPNTLGNGTQTFCGCGEETVEGTALHDRKLSARLGSASWECLSKHGPSLARYM